MSDFFPSLPEQAEMVNLYHAFPKGWQELCDYHDRILRDRSDLTVGERELIAAYVSGLNACSYCYGAHVLAARAFGIDESVFEGLVNDLETAKVDEKIKPLLAYARKMTVDPTKIAPSDAEKVYRAGWSEGALYDAISVICLFNFMNRFVEATGLRNNPLDESREMQDRRLQQIAGADLTKYHNAHEAPASYGGLPKFWAAQRPGSGL